MRLNLKGFSLFFVKKKVLKNFFYCKIVIYLHADFQRFKMIYKIAPRRPKKLLRA
jgi:hypothetical protein